MHFNFNLAGRTILREIALKRTSLVRYEPHSLFTVLHRDLLSFFFAVFLLIWFLVLPFGAAYATVKNYDVIIVGAGTAGVTAGIQAARMGVSVAVFEETDWIGGQMTAAGVANMDEGGYPPAGIYKEFLDKVKDYYQSLTPPKGIGTCYFSSLSKCVEPAVARQILNQMIVETRETILENGKRPVLDIHLVTSIESVMKDGNTLTGIITTDGNRYRSRLVIDATEYGDVIPMTGARYRVGKITSRQINQPSFDIDKPKYRNARIQSITYTAVIKKYPNGVPPQLRIGTAPPSYVDTTKEAFRSIVTEHGSPTGGVYSKGVWSWAQHSGYRGLPNSDSKAPDADAGSQEGLKNITKTSINFANDYPWIKDWNKRLYAKHPDPYPLTAKYLLDHSYRQKINCEAKLRTLEFIHYVQNELNQPWSLAIEEQYDGEYNRRINVCPNIPDSRKDLKTLEKYMPVMPYVRESIRLIGLYTLSAKDIKRVGYQDEDVGPFRAIKKFNRTVIAVGDYAVDLHGASRNTNLESYLGETGKSKTKMRYGPFHVPFECLIPDKIDGFMVAEKNISTTRLAAGAIRLQPITMRIGQAVGIIAAMAVKNDIQPREVNPLVVQWYLTEQGIPLLIIDDNPNTGFLFYSDVPYQHKFWKYVQMIRLREIMKGIDKAAFGVDEYLTRNQLAHILFDLDPLKFSPASHQRFQSENFLLNLADKIRQVARLSSLKMKVYFRESPKPVTRAEFAEIMVEELNLDSSQMKSPPILSDMPKDHRSLRSVQFMCNRGFISPGLTGEDGEKRFFPDSYITKGETAKAIWKIILYQTGI